MVGVLRLAHLLPLLENTYLTCSLDTPEPCALAVSQADVESVRTKFLVLTAERFPKIYH